MVGREGEVGEDELGCILNSSSMTNQSLQQLLLNLL
jgi:hypothetical protein